MKDPCSCGRVATFEACCGRYLGTGVPAPDAESLMRSRYAAFVRRHAAHLLDTWHASTRPTSIDFEAGVKWLGLEVQHADARGDAGVVEFVARCRDSGGRAQRLHEISRFLREQGRWYYIDGQAPAAPDSGSVD